MIKEGMKKKGEGDGWHEEKRKAESALERRVI